MAVDANSYGTAAGVAARAPEYTSAGSFDGTTRPTLEQLEGWIDSLSARINVYVAQNDISVPATDTLATALADIVNDAMAERVMEVNGHKRRGPLADPQRPPTGTPAQIALREAQVLIAASATGSEGSRMGTATVRRQDAYSAAYDTTDVDSGDDTL